MHERRVRESQEKMETMAKEGKAWQEMVSMKCAACSAERKRRARVLEPADKRVHEEPFLSAPYIHQNNDPKYHAMLLRAAEAAKHGFETPRYILGITAQDRPHDPTRS